MRNQPVCLGGDRVDGPAAETGATIELCHVALAVQTQTVSAELLSVCVVSQAGNFFFSFLALQLPLIFIKAASFFSAHLSMPNNIEYVQ